VKDKAGRLHLPQHGRFDVGDEGKTEGHTFEAVRRAINELAILSATSSTT
jgi:hypothetical protein